MKLRNLGSNKTEIRFENGGVVFFSYNTPVAAQLPSGTFIKTSTKWSRTTSKHINQWLGRARAEEVDQKVLDNFSNTGV